MVERILEVESLSVDIPVPSGMLHPVQDLSFHVDRGETLAIVGESGCGKSLTSLALMNLLPSRATRRASKLTLDGQDLTGLSERRMSDLRGNRMSMVFQEPMTSLNPAYTIGDQLIEALRRHRGVTVSEARDRAVWLLEKVGISAARGRLRQYPHQLSGGQLQRVVLARALVLRPDFLIADEPVSMLDVSGRAGILNTMRSLAEETHLTTLYISHDLSLLHYVCDRIAVMYLGKIVELGDALELCANPVHPYTKALFAASLPAHPDEEHEDLTLSGEVPSALNPPTGCSFHTRCPFVMDMCSGDEPPLIEVSPGYLSACYL